ncbi:MAG: hypothetical protein GX083_02500 [Clostridiales bacterium]|nr:hypothetical protein [Clostridiales bacterium]
MKPRKTVPRRKKIILITVMFLIFATLILAIYIKSSSRLLNKAEYKALYKSIQETEDTGGFSNQKSLREFILNWADEKDLNYVVDEHNNIIFSLDAISRKKKVSPTILCVNYNYETAEENAKVLATAAMTAATDLNSGKRIVIFFENEKNEAKGYNGINPKYFTDKSKVIYLDYDKSSYISTNSYAQELSSIQIPAEREDIKCDTAIRIKISGITPKAIDTNITKLPSPINAFQQILTKLKEKSTMCQIADFKIEDHGLMNPVALDATILVNSYSVDSLTKYIEKRIKAWTRSYSDENKDLAFTYEVIENVDSVANSAYTQETFDKLTSVLYTVDEGNYKFEEGDSLPPNKEVGDNYGINAMIGLREENDIIYLDLISQAYDLKHMEMITKDNIAASELFGCTYNSSKKTPPFINTNSSLNRTINMTYLKVNDTYGENIILASDTDDYFTPCAYLQEINNKMDIVHLKMNSSTAIVLSNTILGYIEKKGNFLSI